MSEIKADHVKTSKSEKSNTITNSTNLSSKSSFYIYISFVIILQIIILIILILLTIFYKHTVLTYIFGYIGVSVRYFLSVYFNKSNQIPYGTFLANIIATIIMSTIDSLIVFIFIIYFYLLLNRKLIH